MYKELFIPWSDKKRHHSSVISESLSDFSCPADVPETLKNLVCGSRTPYKPLHRLDFWRPPLITLLVVSWELQGVSL